MVKIGAKYRHFKGIEVRVLGIAKDSETLEDMVIYLELSDGSMGIVIAAKGKDLMRPEVLLQIDKMGRKIDSQEIIDLSKTEELYVRRPMHDIGKVAF